MFAGVENRGRSQWALVVDGDPIADTSVDFASGMPIGAVPDAMHSEDTNWLTWRYDFGTEEQVLAHVRLRLYWIYGARWCDGGAFIPAAWVEVEDCEIAKDVQVDIDVEVGEAGFSGDSAAPNAQLLLSVILRLSGLAGSDEVRWNFVVHGSGHVDTS